MLVLVCSACATTGSSQRGTPNREPGGPNGPKRIKLAVLKVESDQFPALATALNTQLRDVQVKGVDDYFISKVTLEVVQLSIECVEPTPNCYAAVGKSLSAQRLLVARLLPGTPPRRGRHHAAPVTVSVTQIDTEAGTTVQKAEKEFKSEQDAVQGLSQVVLEAAGQEASPSGSATSTPQARAGK